MAKQNQLVGHVIAAIDIADDCKAIRFELADGSEIIARADGDCCSSSWIENVEAPELVIGSPVLTAADIHMPTPRDSSDADGTVVAYYGFRITTAHGSCVLDYRNESNGYYGGNLSWPDDGDFYGGVYEQNVSTMRWRRIAPSTTVDAVDPHAASTVKLTTRD